MNKINETVKSNNRFNFSQPLPIFLISYLLII
jgi:hypothetical protein